ncbi:DUF6221 family protein [Amycolatopsis solani]|uniref:DUF6221 family protein n=1 Tax=Amycolatopsis solani TaxID=3028615 RepID=UPI0025B2552B|nr:DUF6221 family protein [Amycolatopsis sp. MEP2-6]
MTRQRGRGYPSLRVPATWSPPGSPAPVSVEPLPLGDIEAEAEAEVIEALVLFLRKRLDSDRRAAVAATPGPWVSGDWGPFSGAYVEQRGSVGGRLVVENSACPGNPDRPADDVVHVARQDPAKTLRRIAAVRRILDLVTFADGGDGYNEAYRDVVRLLGLEYAGHANYREEWRP